MNTNRKRAFLRQRMMLFNIFNGSMRWQHCGATEAVRRKKKNSPKISLIKSNFIAFNSSSRKKIIRFVLIDYFARIINFILHNSAVWLRLPLCCHTAINALQSQSNSILLVCRHQQSPDPIAFVFALSLIVLFSLVS